MSLSNKPTLLFVHGAWHPASTWDVLRAEIGSEYPTEAPQLPSPGNPGTTLEDDAAHVQKTLQRLVGEGKDVIVITHSYGGAVGALASKGFLKQDRNGKGGIVGFVWLTSWTIPQGESLLSKGGKEAEDAMSTLPLIDGSLHIEDPGLTQFIFYNDLPKETGDKFFTLLKDHPLDTFKAPLTYAPYGKVPAVYIRCLQDNAIKLEVQDSLIKDAGVNGNLKVVDCDASHSAMVSQAKQCKDIIVQLAESVTGHGPP